MHEDLKTTSHIFLRKDALSGALEPPYTSPHSVISRTDKTVIIDLPREAVSVDRVKLAHWEADRQEATTSRMANDSTQTEARFTRSGRRVNFPPYFQASLDSYSPRGTDRRSTEQYQPLGGRSSLRH